MLGHLCIRGGCDFLDIYKEISMELSQGARGSQLYEFPGPPSMTGPMRTSQACRAM